MGTPFPWVFPYEEDGPRLESVVLRPVVSVALCGPVDVSPPVSALVDSGCSHTLAAPWLASAIGVDADASDRTIQLGLGGDTVTVRFLDVRLRLLAPGGSDSDYVEWEDEVGFLRSWRPTWPVLLGQVGFMQRFTVTMSRHAQALAVEERAEFDQRFGIPVVGGSPRTRR
ncbi:aspartyl protease [Motilibacter rhizosphaerae]|uniref:Aspartyl protease n=1 Tax=Motilibacter rhizosphaerae TaxID=598652 RepID=A0A4Q7NVX8_9ACTN|nr:retropepsin-like aspartic protease [Motilibacter rhizosphaerae]RZS91150.1 aspartyl protease [Motilibacter rhizosphaerae]